MKDPTYQSVFIYLHQYSNFIYQDYNELLHGKKYKHKLPTGTCSPFSKKLFLTVKGKILPCERIGHQHSLGEVKNDSVNLNLQHIVDYYNKIFNQINPQCKKCHNQKGCIQCIFNLEDIDKKPNCYGFMNKKEFQIYESNQLDFLRKHPEEYYRIMEEVILE